MRRTAWDHTHPVLVVRPIARSHRKMPAQLRTGTAALIGRRGVVVERVANHTISVK